MQSGFGVERCLVESFKLRARPVIVYVLEPRKLVGQRSHIPAALDVVLAA